MRGWKFRRQHPVGRYVVDFVCLTARLIVELDGDSHDGEEKQVAYEEHRQAWLEEQGFRVLRLQGREVPGADPLEGAWEAVDQALLDTAGALDPSRLRPDSRAYKEIAAEAAEFPDRA